MSTLRLFSLLLISVVLMTGCSTLKQNDPNEKVRAFVNDFKTNLTASDEVIKSQFKISSESKISESGIMNAIRIMQNADQDKDSISCYVYFESPAITQEEALVRVDLEAMFSSTDSTYALQKESGFTLWLSAENGKFFITDIKAYDFYNDYNSTLYDFKQSKHRERDLASRKIFFDQARKLQQTYDSVIWYSQYQDSIYYYVVNGEWRNFFVSEQGDRLQSAKMGLVSESGKVIVPPAYDLVGTISFETDNVIEVQKNNLVGYFTLDGKEIIPALYDYIIPYQEAGAYALVKKDTLYGWIDKQYVHHVGFPSAAAKKYIQEFGYLDKSITVSGETTSTAEIIHVDHMGTGFVIPPTYYVKAKVFDEVITDLYIGNNALGWAGTESVETKGSILEKISDSFSALMVMLNDNYLEGREGFYERTNVTLVDNQQTQLGSFTVPSGEVSFNKIDSTLIELRIARTGSDYSDMYDYQWDAPFYRYLKLEQGTITQLKSERNFEFTQFVKIDSSYLEGKFFDWNESGRQESDFPFDETLKSMRNEILAEYGYEFADSEITEMFSHRKWYNPRYVRYDEFFDSMTDVDKHNVAFLERIIGTLDKKPS